MLILGLNAYHGDASAALLRDGRLVAAVEEERLNRVKHCAGFPELAVRYCLGVPEITTLVLGMRTHRDLTAALAAFDAGPLPEADMALARGLSLGDDEMLNPVRWGFGGIAGR